MAEETIPSPPSHSPIEEKFRGVLSAMSDAVTALLASSDPGRFGRASRLCVMGQKISTELVTSVREAQRLRAQENHQNALAGGLGPEGQYIAQGGGEVDGYVGEQQDYAILNGVGDYGLGVDLPGGGRMLQPRPNDMVTLQRDMLTMVAGWFEDQKKEKAHKKEKDPSARRLDLYVELNELFRARSALQDPKDATLLARVEKQIETYIDLIGKDDINESPAPDTHVVSAELLRGHSLGESEQWGDAGRDRRPVLHREGGDESLAGRGEAERPDQGAVG